MSHHRRRETTELKEYQESQSQEQANQNTHPFLQENDLTILSVISPFLSPNAQKLITFFVNFGSENPNPQAPDIAGLLMQTLKNTDPNFLQNLLPAFLNLSGNSTPGEVLQRFLPKELREAAPIQNEVEPKKVKKSFDFRS